MALLDVVSKGTDSLIQWLDRSFGGRPVDVFTVRGEDGSVEFGTEVTFAGGTSGTAAEEVSLADADTLFTATDVEGALAEVKALVDAGVALQKRTVTIGHADLTDADGSQTLSIGSALPANARILGACIKLTTPFTGGGAGSVTVDIGSAGDTDAIVDGANVFAAAVDGQSSTLPSGIAPSKHFVLATQLQATVAADVNVADLTAGAMDVEVLFAVLA